MNYIISKSNEEKKAQYMQHATKDPMLHMKGSVSRRWMELPVCPHCHRIALRDRRPGDPLDQPVHITCPACGYHGLNTMPVEAFIEGYVIDSSTADVKRRDSWRDMLKLAGRA